MGDWIFAFFHLFALVAILVYAVYSLFQGNVSRFIILIVLLGFWYIFMLHPAVKKEIERKKKKKKS
jgi:hypothetical protein